MAKIELHPTVESISGRMGDVVFRYNRKTGKTSISKVPDMTKVKWSKAQKAHRRRFKKAVAYAHRAQAIPPVWAIYQQMAKKQRKRAWDLAVSDFFKGNDLVSTERAASS